MPVLSNPRHERFAQLLAQGKSADESYEGAGFSPNRGNASRLKSNESILKRIDELQARVAEKVAERRTLTRLDVLAELAEIATAPLDSVHVKPADKRGACVDYARIEGWLIERKEVGQPGEFAAMDDEEVFAEIERRAQKLGIDLPTAAETAH